MPELPEVELVARALDTLLRGRRIERAELLRERLAPDTRPAQFGREIGGTAINSIGRRGKFVVFDLDNGQTLITHLRMTGRFLIVPAEREAPKFTHAIFHLEGGNRLLFQDQRHFGFMKIASSDGLHALREIAGLAPEPLSDEFSEEYLYRVLKNSRRSVKEVLLDQRKVCGLGNIYAAEVLHRAGLHPAKRADRITKKTAAKVHAHIRDVLAEAINAGSTLNIDPENIDGSYAGGNFESRWRVYDREKKPCPVCETMIVRLKQGGRSSYFCPKCQRG